MASGRVPTAAGSSAKSRIPVLLFCTWRLGCEGVGGPRPSRQTGRGPRRAPVGEGAESKCEPRSLKSGSRCHPCEGPHGSQWGTQNFGASHSLICRLGGPTHRAPTKAPNHRLHVRRGLAGVEPSCWDLRVRQGALNTGGLPPVSAHVPRRVWGGAAGTLEGRPARLPRTQFPLAGEPAEPASRPPLLPLPRLSLLWAETLPSAERPASRDSCAAAAAVPFFPGYVEQRRELVLALEVAPALGGLGVHPPPAGLVVSAPRFPHSGGREMRN